MVRAIQSNPLRHMASSAATTSEALEIVLGSTATLVVLVVVAPPSLKRQERWFFLLLVGAEVVAADTVELARFPPHPWRHLQGTLGLAPVMALLGPVVASTVVGVVVVDLDQLSVQGVAMRGASPRASSPAAPPRSWALPHSPRVWDRAYPPAVPVILRMSLGSLRVALELRDPVRQSDVGVMVASSFLSENVVVSLIKFTKLIATLAIVVFQVLCWISLDFCIYDDCHHCMDARDDFVCAVTTNFHKVHSSSHVGLRPGY